MPRAGEIRSPSVLAISAGREGLPALGRTVPAPGREEVVKERLSNLLASLGDPPSERQVTMANGRALARLLTDICPAGTVVLYARSLPGRVVALEHLVVAPRGIVVVGSGGGPPRRSDVVRQTLRRCYALRAWLGGTSWAGTPTFAAVCSVTYGVEAPDRALVLDGLWLGAVDRLPEWLESEDDLDRAGCAALGHFLDAELAVG